MIKAPWTSCTHRKMLERLGKDSHGIILPGREPERMTDAKEFSRSFRNAAEEDLFDNLALFLKAIMPVCNEYDTNTALPVDDPCRSVFALFLIAETGKTS